VPKRYTPEEAKQLLLERGFSPLEPYHGAKERWKAKHLDCGGTVFITLNSIRNPRTKLGSCANCASNAATSEVDAVKIMKKAGLRPLVRFPGYDNPWKSTHVKCGRTVSPRLHSIKAGGNGCRKCGFKQSAIKRTTKNDIAIAELNSAGFEPLEQFRGVRIGWKSRCLTCKKVSSPNLWPTSCATQTQGHSADISWGQSHFLSLPSWRKYYRQLLRSYSVRAAMSLMGGMRTTPARTHESALFFSHHGQR
jgi:hypothetical protein